MRYCAELSNLDSTHYRVVFHGDLYDIQTVDFMNYQKKTIRIMCKLVKKESSHEPDHIKIDQLAEATGEELEEYSKLTAASKKTACYKGGQFSKERYRGKRSGEVWQAC